MKKILMFVLLIQAALAFADPVTGTYKCKGYDPFLLQDYTGVVTIQKNGDTYTVLLDYDTGEKARGTGILHNDTLSIVYQDVNNLNDITVQLYDILPGGKKIEGGWTHLGQNKMAHESCQRI